MNVLTLARADLAPTAVTTLAPATKIHWSAKAALLGRISDESAYGDYATAEAWAKDKLDMTGGEFRLSLKLYRIIRRCEPAITFERWATVSKAKALLLDEVLVVGAEPAEWFPKAEAAKTAEFEQLVRQRLNEEVWTTFKVRVPLEMLGVIEEAIVRAVPHVIDMDADEANGGRKGEDPQVLAQDPAHRFRLLEAVIVHYLQTVEPLGVYADEVQAP